VQATNPALRFFPSRFAGDNACRKEDIRNDPIQEVRAGLARAGFDFSLVAAMTAVGAGKDAKSATGRV
jgi:hypothetical protein